MIESEAFAGQTKLKSLDLSRNSLNEIHFREFLPFAEFLITIYLNENNLTEFGDFTSLIFPSLHTLHFHGNQFRCTYLEHLFASLSESTITWNEESSGESAIRGIRCKQ